MLEAGTTVRSNDSGPQNSGILNCAQELPGVNGGQHTCRLRGEGLDPSLPRSVSPWPLPSSLSATPHEAQPLLGPEGMPRSRAIWLYRALAACGHSLPGASQVGPEMTERGFLAGTLGYAVHSPRALLPVPTGPCTLAGSPSLLLLHQQVLQQEQPWRWTGTGLGQGRSSHKWQRCPGGHQPRPGPEHTLFPEGLSVNLLLWTAVSCRPLLVLHSHCMASCHCEPWPVSVDSSSLNWPFHSPTRGLCSLAWLPSFVRERGWGACR